MIDRRGFSELSPLLATLGHFTAPGPGVTRFTYDAEWCRAHEWLRAEATRRGLEWEIDQAGNLLFSPPGLDRSRHVLLVGSHLDSVRSGGQYDGAYGTIAGLLLAAAHRDERDVPVVAFVTCEEEQSRFDSHMMGARSLLGLVTADELDRVCDAAGTTWRAALAGAVAAGCATPLAAGAAPARMPWRARAELELHIEQGPVLEAHDEALGIVSHIAGYRRLRATLTGAARHSGTTPLALRRDALAAAAEMVLAAEALAAERGEPARVTAGRVHVEPGLYNVVPGACELWLEVRHADAAALAALATDLNVRCAAIAARRGITLAFEDVAGQSPTALSGELVRLADALATERGIAHRTLTSGAAHDTMEFARVDIPALMLFVPSRDGISHSPDEYTEPGELLAGLEFASALIERIAARGSR